MLILARLAALALCATAFALAHPVAARDKMKVAAPHPTLLHTSPLQLAKSLGLFEKEDLDVEPLYTLGGADLLLVCSTTSPLAINDPDRAAGDLRTLATLAAPLGIRICYEALSWGRHVNRWHQAWDIVRRCDHAGVGLNLDSFHMAVHGDDSPETLARLAEVPAEKIFLVQLADYFFEYSDRQADIIELARHQRLFPGEGLHDVRPLVQLLESRGYRGDYTFEVFNDDYVNSDPMVVAQRGMQAARWLGDHAVTRAAAVSTIL